MIKKISYICQHCGKPFDNSKLCLDHEKDCYPCNHCQHQYFVYGCEEACYYRDRHECSAYKIIEPKLYKAKFLDKDK